MKKLIFLLMFLITIPTFVSAGMIDLEIPLEYKYGVYNDSYTYFELIDRRNDYPYKQFLWENSTDSYNADWNMKYHFDTDEVCNTSTVYEYGASYNWSEDLYNMTMFCTENIKAIIETFNDTNNATLELMSNQDILLDLGNCKGRAEELNNLTEQLTIEKGSIQNDLEYYLPFEAKFKICQDDKTAAEEGKTTWGFGGIIVGGILGYLLSGRKKGIEEIEGEEIE